MKAETMLVCVGDVGEFAGATREVARVARACGAKIRLFHVAPEGEEAAGRRDDDALESLAGDPAFSALTVTSASVRYSGNIVDAVLEEARRCGAGIVAALSHGRTGLDRMIHDSTAEYLLGSCQVAVLTISLPRVLRLGAESAHDRVVIPTDFSDLSLAAAHEGVRLAEALDVPATLVHVIEDHYVNAYPAVSFGTVVTHDEGLTERIRARLEKEAGKIAKLNEREIDARLERGRVVPALVDVIEEAENPLVVMSTAGHDSLADDILGTTTARLARRGECSVLALPAAYFKDRLR